MEEGYVFIDESVEIACLDLEDIGLVEEPQDEERILLRPRTHMLWWKENGRMLCNEEHA